MWVLFLNDMRSGNVERLQPVCRAPSREDLLAILAREKVPAYTDRGERTLVHTTDFMAGQVEHNSDYGWSKVYRQGGPLEWFNPPRNEGPDHFRDAGTREDWMRKAGDNYDRQVMSTPVL